MKKVGVIGAGAWGTAVATALHRAGSDVTIWAREQEVVDSINNTHVNTVFLSDALLHPEIKATDSLHKMLDMEMLYLVIPSQFMRNGCEELASLKLKKHVPLILCSKGVTQRNLKLMNEVVEETLPKNPVAVLSGPTFAIEVAQGLPASVTLACKDASLAKEIAATIESSRFKVYHTDDVIGAEIAGAIKNVIAIACGIAEGSQLGENAKAALITRGLKEMKRICVAKGGRAETLMELCGVGDLILTASSQTSRNYSLGYALGKGKSLESILKSRRSVAEGVDSSESVMRLGEKLKVDLPICRAVYRIVHGKENIKATLEELIKSS